MIKTTFFFNFFIIVLLIVISGLEEFFLQTILEVNFFQLDIFPSKLKSTENGKD